MRDERAAGTDRLWAFQYTNGQPMERELQLFKAETGANVPLAHRMRPETLEDFLGQEQLLGDGKPLRAAIERGAAGSMVFWGPPGSGKTTLARLIANYTDSAFVLFSAVTEGVPRVRHQRSRAATRRRRSSDHAFLR